MARRDSLASSNPTVSASNCRGTPQSQGSAGFYFFYDLQINHQMTGGFRRMAEVYAGPSPSIFGPVVIGRSGTATPAPGSEMHVQGQGDTKTQSSFRLSLHEIHHSVAD